MPPLVRSISSSLEKRSCPPLVRSISSALEKRSNDILQTFRRGPVSPTGSQGKVSNAQNSPGVPKARVSPSMEGEIPMVGLNVKRQ